MDNVIGRNIRAHRERLSWTQDQLAAAAAMPTILDRSVAAAIQVRVLTGISRLK